MIFKDRSFKIALTLTLSQQSFLATSTYYIAQAGASIKTAALDQVMPDISLFFLFALMAYIASSAATLFITRAANNIWKGYSASTLSTSTNSLKYASDKNKKSITQWLGGEALPTISHACEFYIEMTSAALNILLTIVVFYISIGWEISSTIMAATFISLVFAISMHRKIECMASDIQQQRLKTLLGIEPAWTYALYGTWKIRSIGFDKLYEKMHFYFSRVNRYVLLKQLVACCPILLSTLTVLGLLQVTDLFTASVVGALVAALPRSLQVFGNVHSLSIYLSQFFLVRTKLRNLEGFIDGLEKHEMHQASLRAISICHDAKRWQPRELIEALQRKNLSCGRFRVTGANGSGKSTFLKIIKDLVPDSLLLAPEVHFLNFSSGLSTGQGQINEIENVISMAPAVLMLDEWDANLDEGNRRRIDQVLQKASRRMLIIEVRHLQQGGD